MTTRSCTHRRRRCRPRPRPSQRASEAGPPSATVKVDRSKLDAFLQQGPQQGEETASTVQVDPARFQAMIDQQKKAEPNEDGVSPRATVQVDRSEIDAFIKKGRDPEPGAEPPPPVDPDEGVDSFATQAIPAFDPDKMGLGDTPPEPPEQPIVEAPVPPPQETAPPQETTGSDEPAPEPDFSGFDAPASFADEPVAPEEPAFPSDADLGIGDEPPATPAIDQAAATEALPVQQPTTPPAPVEEPTAAAVPEPEASETRYKARVDGNIYPNLTLESISRWVKEGRLLDSDEIALEGTEDFRKAVAYDEIKPYFDQFFGEQDGGKSSEKKGFFSKLFSFGK